jgi:pyridoxine 5-phosphate synthase
MTALSVNLNKVAVLRNSRGGVDPDPLAAARVCMDAGCDGITVHPRPDGRHVRHADVLGLRALCRGRAEFNIEGNPFAPPRPGYVGLRELVWMMRPEQCTLVPDDDGQLTSDHGFNLARDGARLGPVVRQLKEFGCRVSVFMDAGADGIETLPALGVDRIELYTGPYAAAHAAGTPSKSLAAFAECAQRAQAVGLGVNAGHDLSQANLADFLQAVPGVLEVSIGHALIGEALYAGLAATVSSYLRIVRQGNAAPR